jgi:hypothetical protein
MSLVPLSYACDDASVNRLNHVCVIEYTLGIFIFLQKSLVCFFVVKNDSFSSIAIIFLTTHTAQRIKTNSKATT